MVTRRRHFGRIRRLPSGRWQARYPGPDGALRPAPHTFRTKADANAWLTRTESELRDGDWQDPNTGQVTLAVYAAKWIAENPRINSPRTRELYEDLLRLHVLPRLGGVMLADLRLPDVRGWRADRLNEGAPELQVAKAYRLLRAILNTAVDDELIRRNPCRIKGAGKEDIAERPTMEAVDVLKVADAIQPRYRALVLLAAFTHLRFGELMFLRRRDVQVDGGVLLVRKSVAELRRPGPAGKRQVAKDTKSPAGRRPVAIPQAILPQVAFHLAVFAEPGPDGRVFIGPKGATPTRNNFNGVWKRACAKAGVDYVRFHDLRHTGGTLAAASGATLRELMRRMGHGSTRAAMIYQHATDQRDQVIADALSQVIEQARADLGSEGTASGRGT